MTYTNYNFNSLSHPSYFPEGKIRATFIFLQEKSTITPNIQKQLLFSAKTGNFTSFFPNKILPVSFRKTWKIFILLLHLYQKRIIYKPCNAINPHARQETFWSEKRVACFRWPIQIITFIHYRTPPIFQRGKSGQLLSFCRKNQL